MEIERYIRMGLIEMASGNSVWRVICKHMIALLFTAEPKAARDFLRQVEEWEEEEKERERLHYKELREYVNGLSKKELQERLYDALVELEDIRNRYW